MINSKFNIKFLFTFIFAITLFMFFPFWESAGIAISFIFVLNFFYHFQNSFDIRYLIFLIASVQWIIGPVLSYHFVPYDDPYAMVIASKKYFIFATPAITAYLFGLFFPLKYPQFSVYKLKKRLLSLIRKNKNLDLLLLIFGLIFSVFSNIVSESLHFIFFLLGGLKYIGILMITLNPFRKKRWLFFAVSLFLLLLSAILDGSFGSLTYWFILMYIIYDYLIKIKNIQKIILILTSVISILIMQSVKFTYRDITWNDKKEFSVSEKLDLFSNLVEQQTRAGISNEKTNKTIISRINQGWIISWIMNNMENTGKYLNGETFYRSVLSTILPGSLYENKLKAGGQEYFTRFTGRRIGETTSMNLSVLGEAYGNYGAWGAGIFMFFFGLFLNLSWFVITKIIKKNPLILLFVPLLFQQVIKAENDFFIIINHLIKSGFFVFLLYFGLSKIYNFRN